MHDTLSNLMDTSKQIITALEKSDWLDRLLILSGLAVFLLVILFILKQRVVDRGLRIALWWTRFIPDDTGVESVKESLALTASTVLASTLPVISSLAVSATDSSSDVTDPQSREESSRSSILEAVLTETVLPSTSYPPTVVPDQRTTNYADARVEL
jgi:protein transport protein SEC20